MMSEIVSKKCNKCGFEGDIDQFCKGHSLCKKCKSNEGKQYRLNNLLKIRENKRQYRLDNAERIKEQKRLSYIKNKEYVLEHSKQYRLNHREEKKVKDQQYQLDHKDQIKLQRKIFRIQNQDKFKTVNSQYYSQNKEKIKIKARQYAVKHKDEIRHHKRIYKLKHKEHLNAMEVLRRKNNLGVKILHNLRTRTHKVLRGINKSQSTLSLLGCTVLEFKTYIENQFVNDMTWENYGHGAGKWNLDHIIPCSIFDLTDPSEQKQCFHFSNHRPLWERGVGGNLEKYKKTNGLGLLYNNLAPFI